MLFSDNRHRLYLISLLILSFAISGCGRRAGKIPEDRQIVATVNKYKMSVTDFKSEINFTLTSKYLSVDSQDAKEELLDEVITKKVLLEEAQKQDFDKQQTFMKEIEHYWGESLIKLLLDKKSKELARDIHVEESEMIGEYKKMKRRVFAQFVMLNDREPAQRLSSSAGRFSEVQDAFADKIVAGQSPEWWVLGDLPRYLEDVLFVLKPGEISQPIECGSNWAVVRMIKDVEVAIEPFERISLQIKANILRRKKDEAIDQWIEELRDRSFVKIDKKVLGEVVLE